VGNFLAGKVVAVTGAGRGIGRAVALGAAAEGARVVVNDYGVSIDGASPTSEIADGIVKEIEAAGGDAVAVADDVSTMAGGQRVVDVALSSYGRLDGVVCVAGILRERMLFNMSEEEWDPVVATHLKGTFTVFRAAYRQLSKRSLRMKNTTGTGFPESSNLKEPLISGDTSGRFRRRRDIFTN
jgi:NAD(P)-dependent dehydrogenase (short-subunit alcohol dehydrogenase family)